MENPETNSSTDQLMVMAGLKDVKTGSQFLFIILSIIGAYHIIIEISSLFYSRIGRDFSKLFSDDSIKLIVLFLALGLIIGGLIYCLNGLNKIKTGTNINFIQGSIGPIKLVLLVALVSFSVMSFFMLLSFLKIGGYRLIGLIAFPSSIFQITFFIFFPFMTFVSQGFAESIKNSELERKSTSLKNYFLIIIGLYVLVFILNISLGSDAYEISNVIGAGYKVFAIITLYNFVKIWGAISNNYFEQKNTIGSTSI